jgi:hypothetical protein
MSALTDLFHYFATEDSLAELRREARREDLHKVPHRGMLADREYYERTTEDFYRLEHFDLEDMFGRLPRPSLSLSMSVHRTGSSSGHTGKTWDGRLVIGIKNSGRGVARSPYLAFQTDPRRGLAQPLDRSSLEGLPRLPSPDSTVQIMGASPAIVIIPGVTLDVADLKVSCGADSSSRLIMPEAFKIPYRLGSEDSRLQEGEMPVTSEYLAAYLFPADVYRHT